MSNLFIDPATGQSQQGQSGSFIVPIAEFIPSAPAPPPTPTPEPTPEPINRPVAPTVSSPEDFAEQQEANRRRIQGEETRQARERVSQIEERFEGIIARETEAGAGRAGSTRARGARAGLLGSSFGAQQKAGTEAFNKEQQQFIQQQQEFEINKVYDLFDQRAEDRVNQERLLSFATREEQIANRDKMIEEGRENFATLGKSGQFPTLDIMDEEDLAEWSAQTGYSEDMLRLINSENQPQATKIDWQEEVIGNTYLRTGYNPATGQTEVIKIELPTGSDGLQVIDGVPYNKIQNDDGTITLRKAEGFEEKIPSEIEQLNISAKKLDIQQKIQNLNSTDLDSKTISQVDKLSTSFDGSPIVKNFNEVQNKKLSIDAIVENGVGGPADLALVFEFMKALDPTSVVRESEYEAAAGAGNIFKGWAAKFNGYLKAEGGMLPEEVKQEFKRLSGDKFDIITRQYENLRDEKARLINQKTGDTDGNDYLIDYNFTKKSGITDTTSDASFDDIWD